MLHKGSQLLLICGLVLSLGVLTACSSPEAVQANAQVMSSGITSTDPNSGASSSSSEIVSSSASSVSSVPSSEVASNPSSDTSSTSNQAPTTSKPSGGTVSTKPASTKPASKPTSTPTKPASKPTSKPTSTAPASKPTSTAPVDNGSFSAKYHGATYGCDDKSQYNYVLEHANVVGSSQYNKAYNYDTAHPDGFEDFYGVPYTDSWRQIVAIRACFSGGTGSGSAGSAYDYFTGSNRMCADKAKAMEAALHEAGYNARLALGTWNGGSHMWVQVYQDGWYNLDGHISTSLNPGYSLSSTGYNLL